MKDSKNSLQFKVGCRVKCVTDVYGLTNGKVYIVERVYKEPLKGLIKLVGVGNPWYSRRFVLVQDDFNGNI